MWEHFKKDTFLDPRFPCVRSNKAIVTLHTGVVLWGAAGNRVFSPQSHGICSHQRKT